MPPHSLEFPGSTATSPTAARSAPAARSRPCIRSASCRTTASSTRCGTSSPAGDVPAANGRGARRPDGLRGHLAAGPACDRSALGGAHVIANISASPFHVGKGLEREEMLITRGLGQRLLGRARQRRRRPGRADLRRTQRRHRRGGRGRRSARRRSRRRCSSSTSTCRPRLRAGSWITRRRALASEREIPDPPVIDLGGPREQQGLVKPYVAEPLDELEQMRRVRLELGLSDYDKNGFGDVVLGVSGGIDSALTAALAVSAGAGARPASRCVALLSTTPGSDAERLAKNLGTDFLELPIDSIFNGYEQALERVRGTRGRHHRGEPPGPHPRDAADGAVEQVRLARRGDGESRSSRSGTPPSTGTWPAGSRS